MTAVDVLNDRVLPFYEEHGWRSSTCSPTTAENTAGDRSGIPSSSTWRSSRFSTGGPTSGRRKPTVSVSAFIAR